MATGEPKTRSPAVRWLGHSADALLSILVLAPLVVSYWRGTFYLLEFYVFPSAVPLYEPPRLYSLVFSLILGITGIMVFSYLQDWLRTRICGLKSPVAELFWKRAYCYVFGIILVNHWRGAWALWDHYLGKDFYSGLGSFLVGLVGLIVLRCLRNTISPPLVAASDFDDYFFSVQTRFRVPRSKKILYFLDNLFSIAVCGTLIVFVIRGAFLILDNFYPVVLPFKTPYNETAQRDLFAVGYYQLYLLTWGLGILLAIICLLLQKPASSISTQLEKNYHWILKLIFEDVYVFLCLAAGIHVWHSIWGFCDVFIYYENSELSAWICHLLGIGGLMLMFHGSSILIKGYQIDGEFMNGEGCWLPAKSFTIFDTDLSDRPVRKQKLKKREQERLNGMMTNSDIRYIDGSDAHFDSKYDASESTGSPLEQRLLTRLNDGRVSIPTAQSENFDQI